MSKKTFFVLLTAIFCLCFSVQVGITFGQDPSGLRVFRPSPGSKSDTKAILIKQWTEYYKKSREFDELYVYKAVALNSPSACEASGNKKKCLGDMDWLLDVYNLGIGRCKTFDVDSREECMAIRKNDCSSLLDKAERMQCEGYLDLDPRALEKGMRMDGDRNIDKKLLLRRLAYYSVFKNNSAVACAQLLENETYTHKVGCYILVNPDPQRAIDRLALDFAYYNYAYQKKDKSACDSINYGDVGNYCRKGISLSTFIEKYFLRN